MTPLAVVQAANAQMIRREYDAALATLEQVLGVDPAFRPALSLKATILWVWKRRPEDALAVFDQMLHLNQNDKETWKNRGVILAKLGRADEALICAQWIVHVGGQEPQSYADVASIYVMLKRHQEAVATWDQGARLFPNDTSLIGAKALFFHNGKNYAAAVESYDAALRIDANNSNLWYNRACSLARIGNKPAMLESLERAIAIRPDTRKSLARGGDSDLEAYAKDPDFVRLVAG